MLGWLQKRALILVFDGPRLPVWLAKELFHFGMGQRGKRIQ